MSDSSNPYANAAAEKQRFIQSQENTQQGRDWNAAIARETASLQQERAQQAGIARHGSSSLVNAQDKESEEREARKGRNLNIPLQGGQPDFSKQAYYSALEEKSKQFGDSVVGGGSLNAAASFMAVGRDGTSNVLGTTHLKIDKTGQDFYLTQHEDRTYEIRTATGQIRSSGKDWDAKKSSDAAYLLSGDFLLDKKNVPLDYKPEIATGKAFRIIDDDGPVDISAYHTGTMANYQAAGIKKNDAAFMSEGLSRAVPVVENTVYLSKVSSSPTEDVYRRYWVSDYGKEGVEVRDGGGQIVLSSGSNDPNVWGPILDSRKGNESMGGKLYQIPERTVQMSEQDRLKEAHIKYRDFINSPDNVAYSSGVISHEDNRDRITRGFERVMGGLSQIDSHSVKVPEIGLLNPNTNLPGGDFTKMLLYRADQSPAGLHMRMWRELIENPTGTTVGGAAIGIYGLYAMGKAAVTDPIGSVVNLPKTVPEAIVGLDEAFKSKPLQTTVALYAGGKVLKPVGSLFKKPTSVTSGKGAPSGPSGEPFKPSPMPELIDIGDVPNIRGGPLTGAPVAFEMPRSVTIADATSVSKGISALPEGPTIQFKPGGLVEIKGTVGKSMESYPDGPGYRQITEPFKNELPAYPEAVEIPVFKKVVGTSNKPNFGEVKPLVDLQPSVTRTSDIPFAKKGSSGYVTQEPILGYERGKSFIEGYKTEYIPETRTGLKKRATGNDRSAFDLKKTLDQMYPGNTAQKIYHQNRELAREFGPDILKADQFHIGSLETVVKKTPGTVADINRIKTPGGVSPYEYILSKNPDAVNIIGFDKIQRIVSIEERIPEGARTYDVPTNLEMVRNPDALRILLEPTTRESAIIEAAKPPLTSEGHITGLGFDFFVDMAKTERALPTSKMPVGSPPFRFGDMLLESRIKSLFGKVTEATKGKVVQKPSTTKKTSTPNKDATTRQKPDAPKIEDAFYPDNPVLEFGDITYDRVVTWDPEKGWLFSGTGKPVSKGQGGQTNKPVSPIIEAAQSKTTQPKKTPDKSPRVRPHDDSGMMPGGTQVGQQLVGIERVVGEPKLQSIPRENIFVLAERQINTVIPPEVFGFPSSSAFINGVALAGVSQKYRFDPLSLTTSGEKTIQRSRSQMMQGTKLGLGQVSRQTVKQRTEPKSGEIFSLKFNQDLKTSQKSDSDIVSIFSQKSGTKSDTLVKQKNVIDTIIHEQPKLRASPPGRPKTKPKTKPKPSHKSKKQFTPDNAYDRIAGSLDIKVINPRVALKNLVGK